MQRCLQTYYHDEIPGSWGGEEAYATLIQTWAILQYSFNMGSVGKVTNILIFF